MFQQNIQNEAEDKYIDSVEIPEGFMGLDIDQKQLNFSKMQLKMQKL